MMDSGRDLRGIHVALHDDGAALEKRRQHESVESGDVKQRRGGEAHLVGSDVALDEDVDVVEEQVAVGQHGALRLPGRSRGLHEHGRIVQPAVHLCDRVMGRDLRVRLPRSGVVDVDDHIDADAGCHRDRGVGLFSAEHQSRRLAVAQHELRLAWCEAGIYQYADRTDPRRGEKRLQQRGVVAAPVGDPVAGTDSLMREPRLDGCDPLGELGERPRRPFEFHSDAIRAQCRTAAWPRPDPQVLERGGRSHAVPSPALASDEDAAAQKPVTRSANSSARSIWGM